MTHDEMLAALARVVDAIGPYREQAVLAGGFVPLVYREAGLFASAPHPALLSGDIDWTLPEELPVTQKELRECLDEAGYVVVQSRSTTPPVHYFLPAEYGDAAPAPLHVEFLTPLRGSETDRAGNPVSPREIQKGVNVQALRYLDLLLNSPLTVSVDRIPAEFQIPNPASFVVQKLLASVRRDTCTTSLS